MRRTALAAGGAALAIALAGCGGGSGNGGGIVSGDAQQLFGNTNQLAQAASAKASKVKSVHFSMKLTGGAQSMSGQGKMRFAGKDTAMSMTMSAAGQKLEYRFIDKVFYFKAPKQLSSMMKTDKPWLKIPLNGDGKLAQTFGKLLDKSMSNADPTKLLQRIDKAGKITKKERTPNGSHYWVEMNMGKALEQMSPQAKQKLAQQGNTNLKNATIPAQIWLNKEALPTKITMDLAKVAKAMGQAQGQQSQAGSMAGKIVTKYHDWGKPVDITAPPKEKVGTFKMPDFGSMPN